MKINEFERIFWIDLASNCFVYKNKFVYVSKPDFVLSARILSFFAKSYVKSKENQDVFRFANNFETRRFRNFGKIRAFGGRR